MAERPKARAKTILTGIGGIVLGCALFFGGTGTLSNSNTVTCGGQTMPQGDTCELFNGGSYDGSRDYDQQQQSNQGGAAFGIIGGLAFLAGGIFLLFIGASKAAIRGIFLTELYDAS